MSFNFMAAVTIWSDFGTQENQLCHSFHFPPSICHEVMGPDDTIFVVWMLSFNPAFSLSSFAFIKRLFSFSSLSVLRVVSSAYLRLLIFLWAVFIPACASSSPAFHIMCSASQLNRQGDNIQPWCTPFPIWNLSIVPCLVLTYTKVGRLVPETPQYALPKCTNCLHLLHFLITLSTIVYKHISGVFFWSIREEVGDS